MNGIPARFPPHCDPLARKECQGTENELSGRAGTEISGTRISTLWQLIAIAHSRPVGQAAGRAGTRLADRAVHK